MADYFGKQTFLNQKGKETVENQVLYKFSSKKDFEEWQKTDLKQFDRDADLRFTRQKATKQDLEIHEKEKGKTRTIEKFETKDLDKNARYLHISHPDPKHQKDFGLVLKFDNEETKREFVTKHGEFYKSNLKELKPTDKRVMTANAHGLFLEHSKNNQNFPMTINLALKNYPLLNPAKKHLAFLSQKDFSKPEIYAFDKKNDRDFFVRTIKNKIAKEKEEGREHPAMVSRARNFNPIAISHAANGLILEGSRSKHFQHYKEYLAFHNRDRSHHPQQKEAITTKQFNHMIHSMRSQNQPIEIRNKDLRSVDVSGIDLKNVDVSGCSFKGKDLSGANLKGMKGKNIDFSGTNLSGASLDNATLESPNFKNAFTTDQSVSMKSADILKGDFKYANLKSADLSDTTVLRSNFYSANLQSASFSGAKCMSCQFHNTNLNKATFDADLKRLDQSTFKDASLKGSSLEGSKFDAGKKMDMAM